MYKLPVQVLALIKNESFDKGINLSPLGSPPSPLPGAMWVSHLTDIHIMDELINDYPLTYSEINQWLIKSCDFSSDHPIQAGVSDNGDWYVVLENWE
tara:strand:+ start:609 stop:899 length:291 start_codon:yes stop_codon:yes gene_type:complete